MYVYIYKGIIQGSVFVAGVGILRRGRGAV
uniref:Uncharacterized protein n=1 Tax=Anguilla anguilla TaxID=7936 RepID=A0A0E9VEA1_ANGAN